VYREREYGIARTLPPSPGTPGEGGGDGSIANRKSQIANQKSKIKNQKSKIKNQKSKIKNQKSKIKNGDPSTPSFLVLSAPAGNCPC
jgi:hypothetical protein